MVEVLLLYVHYVICIKVFLDQWSNLKPLDIYHGLMKSPSLQKGLIRLINKALLASHRVYYEAFACALIAYFD